MIMLAQVIRTMRENQEHPFVTFPLEIIGIVLQFLSMRDALNFSATCSLLWTRHQHLLLTKLLKDPWVLSKVDGFYTLQEMFVLDPFFTDHPPVYTTLLPSTESEELNPEIDAVEPKDDQKLDANLQTQTAESEDHALSLKKEPGPVVALGHILSCTGHLLPTLIQKDPYSYWKIATICGFEAFLREKTDDQLILLRDHHGRGFVDYSSLGGQSNSVEHCLPEKLEEGSDPDQSDSPPLIKHASKNAFDPYKKASIMAAAGGQLKVLKILEARGYDLKCVFPESAPTNEQETLLTYAEMNGNAETIKYLRSKNIDCKIGKGLAFYTAYRGFWKRTTELSEQRNPLSEVDEAKYWLQMAEFAIEKGNLKQVLSLMKEHSISHESLTLSVVTAGNPEVFWHFIEQGWLRLDQRFGTGQTVLHILAMRGKLPLFISVLKDPRCPKDLLTTLDNSGQSVLHSTGRGGRWDIYCYLLAQDETSKLPLVDAAGVTVAHCAAQEGAVWFLKRLKLNNSPLLNALDNEGRTILHSASFCNSPQALMMINEDFDISFDAVDKGNKTPLDYLVDAASEYPENWATLNTILEYTDNWPFLERPHATAGTILGYIIDQNATAYFPTLFKADEASFTY